MIPFKRSLRHPNFPRLLVSGLSMSFGDFVVMVALQWLVLELTDSSLTLGMVWATRTAPHLIWGMLAGTVADRIDRRLLLLRLYALLAFCTAGIGLLIAGGWAQLWHIMTFSFVVNSVAAFSLPARQALVVDIVGRRDAMSSIALMRVAWSITQIAGGLVSGFAIEKLGLFWPFFIVVAGYLIGAVALITMRGIARQIPIRGESIRRGYLEGLKIITRNPLVLTLVVMAISCEILGFSHKALLPVFARDILHIGASGLGILTAVQSLGGLLAALTLSALGNSRYKGRLILGIFLFFGLFLAAFARSPWYVASLILCGLVGAMAAGFDTMQHTLLQLSVADMQRGRAMGIWQLSIGFGPVGSIATGAIAAVLRAPNAVTVNAAVIVLVFAGLLLFARELRRA